MHHGRQMSQVIVVELIKLLGTISWPFVALVLGYVLRLPIGRLDRRHRQGAGHQDGSPPVIHENTVRSCSRCRAINRPYDQPPKSPGKKQRIGASPRQNGRICLCCWVSVGERPGMPTATVVPKQPIFFDSEASNLARPRPTRGQSEGRGGSNGGRHGRRAAARADSGRASQVRTLASVRRCMPLVAPEEDAQRVR